MRAEMGGGRREEGKRGKGMMMHNTYNLVAHTVAARTAAAANHQAVLIPGVEVAGPQGVIEGDGGAQYRLGHVVGDRVGLEDGGGCGESAERAHGGG